MKLLEGSVAVVTGASRGVGRGVALALGEAGACVYITGRTLSSADSRGSLEETAEVLRSLGGECFPVQCDHTQDQQTEEVFKRVREEHSRLDILVNSAWGGYERMIEGGEFTWPRPFWDQRCGSCKGIWFHGR